MSFVHGQLVRCGGPLPAPLRNANLEVVAREGLWLTLTDAQGRTGIGECAPLPGYSRETLEACRGALRRWLEAPGVRDQTLPPAARCAVESALLDLRGHQQGLPAHALLASAPARPIPPPG